MAIFTINGILLKFPIFLLIKINIEVLDSNLPTWSNTSQVMLPWVA